MSRPAYHYPQDFESAKRSFAFVFLLCCFGLAIVAALAFYGGMQTANAIRDEMDRVKAQQPKRASPATFRPNLFCDKTEYQRICRARERLTKVGGDK